MAPPAVNWPAILGSVLEEKGTKKLPEDKAVKYAVKAAQLLHGEAKGTLKAGLRAYLASGGKFEVRDGQLRRAPKKVAKQGAAGWPAIEEPSLKKKRKRAAAAEAAAAAEEAAPQQQEAAAAEEEKAGKKKKKKKRREAVEPAGEEAAGEMAAEQEQPRKKKKKRRQQLGVDEPPGGVASPAAQPALQVGGGEEAAAQEQEGMTWAMLNKRRDVKAGPFSKEEKVALKAAVEAYADEHGLSRTDLDWLFGTTKSGHRGAWKKIRTCLPHRTAKSVWACGTRMFHPGNYQGKWTPEADEALLALVEDKGRRWTEIGAALGRLPEGCRDRWKDIRLGSSVNTGRWSAQEVQALTDAVREYLEAKAQASGGGEGEEVALTLDDITAASSQPFAGGKEGEGEGSVGTASVSIDRRMILDDIDWSAVSQRVGTRNYSQCAEKWYSGVSPSMVQRGDWGAGDDRRLLRALWAAGASREFQLDWGGLVRGRTAAQARRRWRLMVKMVPDSRDRELPALLEYLVDKYAPAIRQQAEEAAAAAAAAAGGGA